MKFFDKLKQGANGAGGKAKGIIEVNKLKIQVSQKTKEIDETLQNIGKTVFDLYQKKNMDELLNLVEAQLQFCIDKKEEIKSLEIKIKELINEKDCPECSKVVPLETKFCSSCGYRFEFTESVQAEQNESISEGQKCIQCDYDLEEGARFCGNCGHETAQGQEV